MMWHDGWGGGHGWWFALAVVTFLAVVGLVAISRRRAGHQESRRGYPPAPDAAPKPGPSALDVLDARYARGELTDEQYLRRRDVLNTH
jgi:putative membrane protein